MPDESTSQGPRPLLRRRGHRLLYPLLLLLVVTALVPMATFAWKTVRKNRDALTTSEQEKQLLVASAVSNTVDTYIDGVGRKYRIVEHVELGNSAVATDQIHGSTGKLWKVSLPYYLSEGSPDHYREYQYDAVGRETSVTNPDGTTWTRSYGDGTVTVTDPNGTWSTAWQNAYGWVTKVRQKGMVYN